MVATAPLGAGFCGRALWRLRAAEAAVQAVNLCRWFGPLAFLLLALWGWLEFLRRPAIVTADRVVAPLSAEEKKRLEKLLRDEDNAR